MTEYISREEALNFELEIEAKPDDIQAITKGMALYAEHIKNIPAADVVEKKIGEWVNVWHDFFNSEVQMCSNCNGISVYKTNFCQYCGATMNQKGD